MRTLALAVAFCFACGIVYEEVRPMVPVPDSYAGLYTEMETCLGTTGDFGAIDFFVADYLESRDGPISGAIELPNTITLLVSRVENIISAKHEMGHHIKQEGNSLHDSGRFWWCVQNTTEP